MVSPLAGGNLHLGTLVCWESLRKRDVTGNGDGAHRPRASALHLYEAPGRRLEGPSLAVGLLLLCLYTQHHRLMHTAGIISLHACMESTAC